VKFTFFMVFTAIVNHVMAFRSLDHVVAQKPTRTPSFEIEK